VIIKKGKKVISIKNQKESIPQKNIKRIKNQNLMIKKETDHYQNQVQNQKMKKKRKRKRKKMKKM